MKRLFIGLSVPPSPALEKTGEWKDWPGMNKNRLSWTAASNRHITLCFFGAMPESSVPAIAQQIEEIFDRYPAGTAFLKGLGVFPGPRRPKVLWIGLENFSPMMTACQQLHDSLLQAGLLSAPSPFRPHLTIARIKSLPDQQSMNALLNHYRNADFGPLHFNQILLYESISTPNGVVYQPLYEKRLKEKREQGEDL